MLCKVNAQTETLSDEGPLEKMNNPKVTQVNSPEQAGVARAIPVPGSQANVPCACAVCIGQVP